MEAKEIYIAKGNEIIEDFMGYQWPTVGPYTEDEANKIKQYEINNLRYHKSWDCLMPVIKKVVYTDTGTLDVYRLYVEDALKTLDIEQVWEAIIDFIQWYNQNKGLGENTVGDRGRDKIIGGQCGRI